MSSYKAQQENLRMEIMRRNLKEKRQLECKLLVEIRTLKAMAAAYKLQKLTGTTIRF